jgi:hypothetical protein
VDHGVHAFHIVGNGVHGGLYAGLGDEVLQHDATHYTESERIFGALTHEKTSGTVKLRRAVNAWL